MCRAGGRRCTGSRNKGATTSSTNTSGAAAVPPFRGGLSTVVERDGKTYMVVGLSNSDAGPQVDLVPVENASKAARARARSAHQEGRVAAETVPSAGLRSLDEPGASPTTAAPQAARSGGVPTREDADRLAAELPASRRGWDGSPLNEKDKRFFGLRDSGYTGPIDQNGYPDTTSDDAATLRRMARDRGETVNW